jgi:hypothetical protein
MQLLSKRTLFIGKGDKGKSHYLFFCPQCDGNDRESGDGFRGGSTIYSKRDGLDIPTEAALYARRECAVTETSRSFHWTETYRYR